MTDRDANRQLDAPRARLRPECIPAVYLPGRVMWPWISRAYAKLSARDLLALAGHPFLPVTTEPEQPASPAAPSENLGTKPGNHGNPLPGFTNSPPPDPGAPQTLSYTQAWNPVHAKNRKDTQEHQPSARDPWNFGVSDVEFILLYEVSRKFPEAYAYVIQRVCERAGVPVPDAIRPPGSPGQEA